MLDWLRIWQPQDSQKATGKLLPTVSTQNGWSDAAFLLLLSRNQETREHRNAGKLKSSLFKKTIDAKQTIQGQNPRSNQSSQGHIPPVKSHTRTSHCRKGCIWIMAVCTAIIQISFFRVGNLPQDASNPLLEGGPLFWILFAVFQCCSGSPGVYRVTRDPNSSHCQHRETEE